MAQPTAYTPAYDFSDYQSVSPNDPLPGDKVDDEFAAIKVTTDEIRVNLALIQRDDGALANRVVTPDSLSVASLALIGGGWTPRGAWVTATAYAVSDVVSQGGVSYVCVTAHTSGTFSTDLAAGKWLTIGATAAAAVYDNTTSGLTATTAQDAIDEIQGDAAKIDYSNAVSGLVATNVKAAIDEVDAKADANAAAIAALSAGLADSVATVTTGTTDIEHTADGKLYLIDASGGAVTINLPAIGAAEGTRFLFRPTNVDNTITIARDGTDTIAGAASNLTLATVDALVMLVADDTTPDNWIAATISQVVAGTGLEKSGDTISIADGGVGTTQLADGAVTPPKAAGSGNAQTGTSYTLALTDTLLPVTMTNASANTLTIPPNASVAFPTWARVDVLMLGAGTTTIQAGTGVTLNGVSEGAATIEAQYSGVSILKTATDTWVMFGNHGAVS